jgi:hypothetical protein
VAKITVIDIEITKQPFNGRYALADTIAPLTVETSETDTSELTFQWYKNTTLSNTGGEAISGANSYSYTPSFTAAGDYYFYVTIQRRQNKPVSSNAVLIKVETTLAEAPTLFTIDDTRYNYVRGVGGTGAFMFRGGDNADASPDADVPYIDKLFGELGCNILRIMVQDEYEKYITNEIQSKNVEIFFHNAKDNFFPVIRRANEYGGYVFANAWTAPASMKSNGSPLGGQTNPGLLKAGSEIDYAEHLRNFLIWLNDNDAPIFCLGILNEPDFGAGNNGYEGMGLTGSQSRDWFKLVGHFTTQRVSNPQTATIDTARWVEDIIPGYGGGGPTHHVLAMSGDPMGDMSWYNTQLDDPVSNNRIEVMGRHYYAVSGARYVKAAGAGPNSTGNGTAWNARPQLNYTGPYEEESLGMSPQMYAPGSVMGSIKREIWQTEHDFNHGSSTVPKNVVTFWNAAFAALNEIDYTLRVAGESVHNWWFSSSFSGYVTSNHTIGWPAPYTITPRGRAVAHYARYANETWLLGATRTRGNITFNNTGTLDAASTTPKFNAFEDIKGRFISVVMFAPPQPTDSSMTGGFGQGGTGGSDDPTRRSTNVGRVAIALPDGFTATGVTAMRSYGSKPADGQDWDTETAGSPRYWIDEPVFLSADGKTAEVELRGGHVISIKFTGKWNTSRPGYPAGY